MAGGGRGGSEMEVEAGEIVSDGSDMEMPGLSGDGRVSGAGSGGNGGSNGRRAVEDSAWSKESVGGSNVQIREHGGLPGDGKGDIPQDVLLAAEAALPANGHGNGVPKECEGEEDESEEDDEDNAEGMVEADSDPLVESEESSDSSSEEEDVNAADMEKHHIEGAEELDKMVQRAKEVDSDEEDGATEPPRTANEVTVFFLTLSLTDSCLVSGSGEAISALVCR